MQSAYSRLIHLTCLLLLFALAACAPPQAVIKSPAQVLAELEPHYRVSLPEGAGPFPTILLLHGASDLAWYNHFETVSRSLNQAGFATIFVDSYAGRGLTGRALRSGRLLPGERAADLLITLDWAARQSWVQPEAIGALGYSHGAATIMDALVLAPPARTPTGLTTTPAGALQKLKAAVLFYPWCNADIMGVEVTKAYDEDWSEPVPLLAFLPLADKASDSKLCAEIFARESARGMPVTVRELPGVGHTFDQARDDHGNPQKEYNPDAAATAYATTIEYFRAKLSGR